MTDHPVRVALVEVRERYKPLPKVPLRITARMAGPVVQYHGLHLDSILAYVVMEEVMQHAMIHKSPHYLTVPLPLKKAWWSPITNVPLWCSTDFASAGPAVSGVMYLHRRSIEPTMHPRNIRTEAGPYKERRTPMPTVNADALTATCIGNPEEIARLLGQVSALGKKRTVAGAVRQWEIEPIDSFSFFDAEGRALRPIPTEYLGINGGVEMGYSPPYWYLQTRGSCIPAGKRIEDFDHV